MKMSSITLIIIVAGLILAGLYNIIFGEGEYMAFCGYMSGAFFLVFCGIAGWSREVWGICIAVIVVGIGLAVVAIKQWPEKPAVNVMCCDNVYRLYNEEYHCSPLTDTVFFICYGEDTTVKRTTRCSECGRRYMDHYKKVYSLKKWNSRVMGERRRREYFDDATRD